jgi:hypothetical protein
MLLCRTLFAVRFPKKSTWAKLILKIFAAALYVY